MIEKTIKVQIDNFEVDEKYYWFDYKIYVDNELVIEEEYNDDHCWENLEEFKCLMLLEDEAVKLALDKYTEN